MSNLKNKMIIIFFLSGISGLIYEIIWTRILSAVFGSSIYAITIIISIFMAGLALGSYIFGKFIDKNTKHSHFKIYAFIELSIALSATVSFFLLPALKYLYLILHFSFTDSEVLLNLFRFLGSFIILIVPTILMGGTLPVLLKALITDKNKSTGQIGLFYGVNTLGAFTGVALSGFLLIEKIGVKETFFLAVLLNLFIGLYIFFRFKETKSTIVDINKFLINKEIIQKSKENKDQKLKTTQLSEKFYYILLISYGFSGFAALALETLWTRSLIFFIGSSTYAFSIILMNFLLGISIGSFLITKLLRYFKNYILLFSFLELALTIFSLLTIILFRRYSAELNYNPAISDPLFLGSLNSSFFFLFIKTFYIVFPSTLIMGMLFPVVNHIFNKNLANLGKDIGKIYSSNTFGTIFGSLFVTFISIPLFGVSKSIAIFSSINVIIAIIIFNFSGSKKFTATLFYFIPVLIIIFVLFIPYLHEFRSDTEKPDDQTLFYKEDVAATVKVYSDKEGYKSMSVNGMMIGGTQMKTMRKQVILAHLPMLFHPNPKRVLTVGLGTGITLSELALYKPDRLDCVELIKTVMEGTSFFNQFNSNIFKNDNTKIYIEDGRNFLLASRNKYDVIIDDSMLRRESAGNGPLYSDEYYRDCFEHLDTGGLFCQWLPLYLERGTYQMVLKTLQKNFPHTFLFYLGHAAVVQIASKESLKIDIDMLRKKLAIPEIREHLALVEMDDIETIVQSILVDDADLKKFINSDNINSDNFPLVEFIVPREKGLEKTFSDNLLELAPYRPKEIPPSFYFSPEKENEELKARISKNWNTFHYILSGSILTHAGEIRNGQNNYLKALEINPNDKHAIYFLGISRNENKITRARSFFEIGNLFLTRKNINNALEYLGKSIDADSSFANGYNALANLYFDIGKINDAIFLGEKSIEMIPNNATLLYNLATYYEEAKNYKRAYSLYEESLKIDPTNKYALEGKEACKKQI